jgi:hypothetical protein
MNKAKSLNMLDIITSCTYENGITLYEGYSNIVAEDVYSKRIVRKSMEGAVVESGIIINNNQQKSKNLNKFLENNNNVVNLNNVIINNPEENRKVVLHLPSAIKKNLKIKKNVKILKTHF